MEPPEDADVIAMKAGNMILNRFCIDEDAAFELSGVNSLEKTSQDMHGRYGVEPGRSLNRIIQKQIDSR